MDDDAAGAMLSEMAKSPTVLNLPNAIGLLTFEGTALDKDSDDGLLRTSELLERMKQIVRDHLKGLKDAQRALFGERDAGVGK